MARTGERGATADEIAEAMIDEVTNSVDGQTLDAGISQRGAADIYRQIAQQLVERAQQLEHESGADGDD